MFTGIVTEIGKVKSLVARQTSVRLEVECEKVREGVKIGDSVAVNGVCLTVVENKKTGLVFDVVKNTFKNTDLKRLKSKGPVNIENALKAGDPIGGHMVSGHVDGERIIKNNKKTSAGWILDISMLPEDKRYVVPKGSVAIDGVSLTVGEIMNGVFRIFVIPHTLDNTTLLSKKMGNYVNVEFDSAAKYADAKGKSAITGEMLREQGFV